jgi:signal transduction histidine kinase
MTMRALHRWYDALWVLLGLCVPVVAVWDDPGTTKYWSLALPAALGLCYAGVRLLPGRWAMPPRIFLYVLILVLGVMAALPGGGAAMFIVSLPLFWIYAGGPRQAVGLSGAAALFTVFGSTIGQGWSPDFGTGNVVAALAGYAGGTLLGLWLHGVAEQSNVRAARLGAELERAQHQLAEAHRREGAAAERERLAREIHDTLAQGFASIVVLAEAARGGLPGDTEKSVQKLQSIQQTARENLAEARPLVGAAQPGGVAPGSVAATLRRTLERFTEDTGLAVIAELPDLACDQPTRIALLRCTQESLANIRKHAGASTVGVVLAEGPDGVELEITDDGRGFVVGVSHGFGLEGMRRRLAEFGGELTVTSSPGEGTRILAAIPRNGQV